MKSRNLFLSLGSNIEPEHYLPRCIELLKDKLTVLKISSLYETDPVGPAGGEMFWNAVVEIESADPETSLIQKLRGIETSLGRKRDSKNKFAPRTIDIDILPQPGYQKQGFIMIPLAEISPAEKDPETGKTFAELAEKLEKDNCRKV